MKPAQVKMLDADLDPRRVFGRQGSGGKTLSYLQTHDVKRTANRIFGYDGWSYDVQELVCIGEEPFKNRNGKEGVRVGYRATISVQIHPGDERHCYRTDVGYGDSMEYQGSKITPHELAAKEAVSDALKRALASFGDQFGLVLYGADPAPSPEPAPANSSPDQSDSDGIGTPSPDPGSDDHISPATIGHLRTVFAEIRKVAPDNEILAHWDAHREKAPGWSATTGAVWLQRATDEWDLLKAAVPS